MTVGGGQQSSGIAAGAEGAVDIDLAGARIQRRHHFCTHDGEMRRLRGIFMAGFRAVAIHRAHDPLPPRCQAAALTPPSAARASQALGPQTWQEVRRPPKTASPGAAEREPAETRSASGTGLALSERN